MNRLSFLSPSLLLSILGILLLVVGPGCEDREPDDDDDVTPPTVDDDGTMRLDCVRTNKNLEYVVGAAEEPQRARYLPYLGGKKCERLRGWILCSMIDACRKTVCFY